MFEYHRGWINLYELNNRAPSVSDVSMTGCNGHVAYARCLYVSSFLIRELVYLIFDKVNMFTGEAGLVRGLEPEQRLAPRPLR